MDETQRRSFVRAVLPWIVAGVMLLIYLVTLDKVVTVHSVWALARAIGMEWHPTYTAPLSYLVTLPVRWLPSGAQLLALNFISAVCAALTLGLLARTVAILPHDRTHLQRDKATDANAFLSLRLAWVPVLFAVVVCGFQRSFWENAVVNMGEMLDLLLFAYCLRCLLEYRIEENNTWLYKLAFVYGLGMTNNFAMIAFVPVLLIALVWIKGLRFFRFDFLVRMFLLGLAGLSLYLVLPITQSGGDLNFWNALKTNMVWQKHMVLDNRKVALFPALYTLIPLLLMGVRWPSSFGDQSPMGSVFSNGAAVLLHAGLLGFWLYIAFDPPGSAREIGAPLREAGFNYVFLPCYYLGALIVGYYSGFLLLVFNSADRRARRRSILPPALSLPVAVVVCGGALFVAGKLLYQNYPKIQHTTSRALHEYATALVKSLPDKPTVVLSDDTTRLHAVGALLGREGASRCVLLHARSLIDPAYHRFLRQRYGERVPELKLMAGHFAFPAPQLTQFLTDLGLKNELVYLHPSYGPFFEAFYLEPRDLVYTLKPYPTNTIEAPPPSAALIAQQKKYWDSLGAGMLKDLKAEVAELPDERRQRYEFTAAFVGEFCARALDYWGVELQRANRFAEALPVFNDAVALDPDNVSALINRDVNMLWVKEKKRLPELSKDELDKLKTIHTDAQLLLGTCGPVDEASFLTAFSEVFAQGGLYRQAEQMILRALAYAPDELTLQLPLVNIHLLAEQPDRALTLLSPLRSRAGTNADVQIEIARMTAWAQYEKDDFPGAVGTLQEVIRAHPELDGGYDALAKLHGMYAEKLGAITNAYPANVELTNALKVVDKQLATQPTNAAAFFMRGRLCVMMNDFDGAISAFTTVLQLRKDSPGALLNRAIAKLQSKHYDDAKADYEEFRRRFAPNYRLYYGLGEIAYQQKDWSAAREHYKNYLIYAPPNSAESQFIRDRLQDLKKK